MRTSSGADTIDWAYCVKEDVRSLGAMRAGKATSATAVAPAAATALRVNQSKTQSHRF
jgi:hypothetical protein